MNRHRSSRVSRMGSRHVDGERAHRHRSRRLSDSRTIRRTKATSPPGVIISVSAPVQTFDQG
jgi:hypothetical protein